MRDDADYSRIDEQPKRGEVERLAPDHCDLGGDDRIANNSEGTAGDQLRRCIERKRSPPTPPAEDIEADKPDRYAGEEQSTAEGRTHGHGNGNRRGQ